MTKRSLAAVFLTATITLPLKAADAPPLHEHRFELKEPAEVLARFSAGCGRCDWGTPSREAALLKLSVDGRYSQHVFLVKGERPAAYEIALGALGAGPHRLAFEVDAAHSAKGVGRSRVAGVSISALPASRSEQLPLSLAPILYARPNTVGGFTDPPLVMWYETEKEPRGTWYRYSVIFSNEDGGTSARGLMARWGRLTDIEYVYGVLVDGSGAIVEESYQAKDHKILAYRGRREGRHPLLYVVTDNNMVSDEGTSTQRYAPAPIAFPLADVSREAVMDAQPWTYRVSVTEARREGRVEELRPPEAKTIPDPRRFATLEACVATPDLRFAVFAFGVGVRQHGSLTFFDSDEGDPRLRIERSDDNLPNGCFRGAVALPAGVAPAQVAALRVRAFTRKAGKDEPPLPPPPGPAHLLRVNKLFFLGADDMPGPNLLHWTGETLLTLEGAPAELPISPASGTKSDTKGTKKR